VGGAALRIVRTCRELGIETVVGWDGREPVPAYVLGAHRFVVGTDAGAWVDEARKMGVDAVHPGLGTYARDGALAACAVGLRWIGPPIPAGKRSGDVIAEVLLDAHGQVSVLPPRRTTLHRGGVAIVRETPLPDKEQWTASARDAVRHVPGPGLITVSFASDAVELDPFLAPDHVLTDALTGLDLVAVQLALAVGDPAPAVRVLEQIGIAVRAAGQDMGWLPATAPTREAALRRLRRVLGEHGEPTETVDALLSGGPDVDLAALPRQSPPLHVLRDALLAVWFAEAARTDGGIAPSADAWTAAARREARRQR
jgi:biotin carboxylase